MQIPPGFDTSDAMYEMIWTEKAVQWSVNGQRVATYSTKDASTAWVDSSLPIRLGLWALTDGDWAGQLDWSKNPSADATFTSLKLSWSV